MTPAQKQRIAEIEERLNILVQSGDDTPFENCVLDDLRFLLELVRERDWAALDGKSEPPERKEQP